MAHRCATGNADRARRVRPRVLAARADARDALQAALLVALLLATTLLALTDQAQAAVDWRFEPAVELGFRTTDNVQIASAATDESDTILSAAITLSWVGVTRVSSFTFSYEPSHDVYTDFSDLDNTNHRLRLGWNKQSSERTRWDARVEGSLNEDTRLYAETTSLDLVAVPRGERTDVFATLGASVRVARRDALVLRGTFRTTSYDKATLTGVDLDGDGTGDVPPLSVADSDEIGLTAGWQHQLARDSSFSAGYRGSTIDEGFRGEADVHRLELGYRKGSLERVQFEARLGAGRRSDSGVGATPGDNTDVVGQLSLDGRLGRRGRFSAGLGRDISGTSGVSGVAVTDAVYGTLAVPTSDWSDLSLYARWSDRDPVSAAVGARETETTSFGARWAAAVAPQWLVVLGAQRVDQESTLAGDPRNAEVTTYSAGIRWRLRAPVRGS